MTTNLPDTHLQLIQPPLPFIDLTAQVTKPPARRQIIATMKPYRAAIDIQQQISSLVNELNQTYNSNTSERPEIHAPWDCAQLMTPIIGSLDHEELYVLNLNTRNHVIRLVRLYVGAANASQVRVAEVFRQAIIDNATSIVVAHNHPSGDPTPSPVIWRICQGY